jgi:hypothetical protein
MEDLFEAARRNFFGIGSSAQTDASSVSERPRLFREFTQRPLPEEPQYPMQAAVLVAAGSKVLAARSSCAAGD